MRKIGIFLSGWLCISMGACSHVERQAPHDIKTQVEDTGRKAEAAFMASDVEAMLQYYKDDVISMPQFYPMVRGKDDLRRKTEAILSTGIRFDSLESTVQDVKSDGRYVYEVGTFRQAVRMPNADEPIESAGKYVTIWERQPDGQLKIAVEIYNSDSME